MKTLPCEIKRIGFCFEQVTRRGDLAIYKQRLHPGVGCLAFEVIRILQRPARRAFGQAFAAQEVYPTSEQWGTYGFTLPTLEAAQAKLAELESAEPTGTEAAVTVNAAA
jgi:hypothetical protein